ncbi:tol-pal system protein YbgF [Neptunicoccus cionae]|nr:tol-pal system protein YbgF [Amylibacter cionae]
MSIWGTLKMRILRAILVAAVLTPLGAQAQDGETLADIRQELEFLYADVVSMKRELSTTGAATQSSSNAPALQRIDALEAEMRRLTGAIEEKQFWIESIVNDGTNRIGDLEFRLCELEANCDVSALDRTAPLGGKISTRPRTPVSTGGGTQTGETSGTTSTEQNTFQQAMAAYESQDYASAAAQFDTLISNFPGGPLTGEAHYWKGAALAAQSNWDGAARSFLESFSGAPEGTKAPEALYRLGLSLKELGQQEEACLMLAEVPIRYPAASIVGEAQTSRSAIGCS